MKERDFFVLQEIAKQGNMKYINLVQKGDFAVAESSNGYCYLRTAEKNIKPFKEGFFDFTGRFVPDEVQLPQGYEILSLLGKKIGAYVFTEPYEIPIGKKGEFFVTFKRFELLDFFKRYLSGWRTMDADKYQLIFHKRFDLWSIRGYANNRVFEKKITTFKDNISETSFNFCVNPHTFRLILKWFEGDNITLNFRTGNHELRTPIFFEEDYKLAVLMPIARKSK